MIKVIAVILGIIWAGFTAVCLFMCLIAGPSPDAGIMYLIICDRDIGVIASGYSMCLFLCSILGRQVKESEREKI